mmetsp:Transcript_17960/g.48818  ORF Transcript_17960/g.48818 Transcript_17960/m.48818 type:complete len:296 (-) Transcript_17960:770-1657(-)
MGHQHSILGRYQVLGLLLAQFLPLPSRAEQQETLDPQLKYMLVLSELPDWTMGALLVINSHHENYFLVHLTIVRQTAGETSWSAHNAGAGNLLHIDSPVFQNTIETYFQIVNPSARRLWIGLNDLDTVSTGIEGEFVWADDAVTVVWSGGTSNAGGASQNSCFANWDTSEPNVLNSEDCATVRRDGGGWNDLRCNTDNSALIQFPVGTTINPAIYIDCQTLGQPASTFGTAAASGGANGDPHFLRWGQKYHDSFHGECDLVLTSNKAKAIHAQIRTKGRKWYSYIYKVVIAIGSW